ILRGVIHRHDLDLSVVDQIDDDVGREANGQFACPLKQSWATYVAQPLQQTNREADASSDRGRFSVCEFGKPHVDALEIVESCLPPYFVRHLFRRSKFRQDRRYAIGISERARIPQSALKISKLFVREL